MTCGNATVRYVNKSSARQWIDVFQELRYTRYDLILINGVWGVRFSLLPAVLHVLGVLRGPMLLMPHGELEPGALTLKALKKRMAAPFFRLIYRRAVAIVGVTSDSERGNVRMWFPRHDIVVWRHTAPDMISFGSPDRSSSRLRTLYLSRIHPTKGLLQLLLGLRRTKQDISLQIAGPIEDAAYWARCQAVMEQMPDNVEVRYSGLASRGDLPSILWNSDCLVLLTAGENFGHVIAESLQAGCPVITTESTPWTNALVTGGGQVIGERDDSAAIASVLDTWAKMNSRQLATARVGARAAFDEFAREAGPNIVEIAESVLQGWDRNA